jgi:hypothetical protein
MGKVSSLCPHLVPRERRHFDRQEYSAYRSAAVIYGLDRASSALKNRRWPHPPGNTPTISANVHYLQTCSISEEEMLVSKQDQLSRSRTANPSARGRPKARCRNLSRGQRGRDLSLARNGTVANNHIDMRNLVADEDLGRQQKCPEECRHAQVQCYQEYVDSCRHFRPRTFVCAQGPAGLRGAGRSPKLG